MIGNYRIFVTNIIVPRPKQITDFLPSLTDIAGEVVLNNCKGLLQNLMIGFLIFGHLSYHHVVSQRMWYILYTAVRLYQKPVQYIIKGKK